MAITCTKCGKKNPKTAFFCQNCNYPLPLKLVPVETPKTAIMLGQCSETGKRFGVRFKRQLGLLWFAQEIFEVKEETSRRGGYGKFKVSGFTFFAKRLKCCYCGAKRFDEENNFITCRKGRDWGLILGLGITEMLFIGSLILAFLLKTPIWVLGLALGILAACCILIWVLVLLIGKLFLGDL
jgi:hypothetical protein